jgi:hypothetical protein
MDMNQEQPTNMMQSMQGFELSPNDTMTKLFIREPSW